jgi:hypothetical protein
LISKPFKLIYMKKIALICVAFLFTAAVSNAQESGELKGPAAKNYKPWNHQAKSSTMMLKVNPNEKTGPEFKNDRIWDKDTDLTAMDKEAKSTERKTGPEAKNRKPWKNN